MLINICKKKQTKNNDKTRTLTSELQNIKYQPKAIFGIKKISLLQLLMVECILNRDSCQLVREDQENLSLFYQCPINKIVEGLN